MSGTQTQGFDVIYEITTTRFLEVLKMLFVDDLPLQLNHVDFVVPLPGTPVEITQAGALSLAGRPAARFALDTAAGANAFTLTVDFPNPVLTLQGVPAIVSGGLPGLPGGFAGLPASLRRVGTATLTLHLAIDTTAAGGGPIAITSVRRPELTIDLTPLGAPPLPVPPGVMASTLIERIRTRAVEAVVTAVEALLPLTIPLALPVTGPCDIFPRIVRLKFLPRDGMRPESLAFLLMLRNVMEGRFADVARSSIAAGSEGGLQIANALARDLICCLLPRSPGISGLPSMPTEVDANCCRWRDLPRVTLGGQTFPEVELLEVCLGDGHVAVRGRLIQRGTGWWARARVELRIAFRHSGDALLPVNASTPVIEVEQGLEWWVWLLVGIVVLIVAAVGAVVGFFIGGPPGAAAAGTLIGAGVGLLVGGLISAAIIVPLYGILSIVGTTIGTAIGTVTSTLGALQLLPGDLTRTFGSFDITGDPLIDDIALRGRVRLPDHHTAQSEAADRIIEWGEKIDLDHGAVFARFTPHDLDADLELAYILGPSWRPRATQIAACGSARLVPLDEPFASVTEGDVAALRFPTMITGIAAASIPVSTETNPRTMAVFAMRTTEGRLAKCGAWRDARGRVHLRYRTWNTLRPLWVETRWSATRGAIVDRGVDVLPWVDYEVSREGTFRAHISRLMTAPVRYQWAWNGAEIDGSGTLPGADATFTISGPVCRLRTRMRRALEGELCLTAIDASGFAVTACTNILKSGTERSYETSILERVPELLFGAGDLVFRIPMDDPAPDVIRFATLAEQLPRAIAAGMEMDVRKVVIPE